MDKFSTENRDWICDDSDDKTWVVLYHGTDTKGVEGISKEYIKPGLRNLYGGEKCRLSG